MPLEHLLVFDDREVAEGVADGLDPHTYAVRVLRDALAGEDDAEDAQWVVHVTRVTRVTRDVGDRAATAPSETDPAVERAQLEALAEDNGGWYDPVD